MAIYKDVPCNFTISLYVDIIPPLHIIHSREKERMTHRRDV